MKFINHFWSTFWNLLRTVCKAQKIFLNKLIGFVIYPVEFAYDSSTNWSMKKNLHLKVPGRNPQNFWISCLFVDSSKSEHGSRRICSTNKGSIWTSSRTIEAILKFTSLKLKDGAHIRSLRFEECNLVLSNISSSKESLVYAKYWISWDQTHFALSYQKDSQ